MRASFDSAQPFSHVIFDPFLDQDFCRELIAEFPDFDTRHAVNERGEVGRKAARPNLAALGRSYARFDRLIRDRSFLSLMSQVTGIPDLLYDPEYVGGLLARFS